MSDKTEQLAQQLEQRLASYNVVVSTAFEEVTVQVPADTIIDVCTILRDEPALAFEQLMDVCGVDYLEHAQPLDSEKRYAVVYHLLSLSKNQRLRVKAFVDSEFPVIASVIDVWASTNWFEREAFDLFGIVFEGHPDLRRILTDYGFVGHPFRKDFPLTGNVEMRYDEEKKRVIYEPVSIEPRITVPRTVREDHRYVDTNEEGGA
ncbi:MAG: NADH-quinone oxidoreductase subunit C [Gammaproteobacteria bacterium]|nr:NADH-quinone oxidoreductase subunit C [Gammaproteobacteria bacterium]